MTLLPRRHVIALLAAAPVGGCAALEFANRAPPTLFQLTPKSTFDEDLPDVHARVLVEVPTATAGLNTARIALRPQPTMLEYYASSLWVDVLPVMVQTLFIETLDNTRKLDAVGLDTIGVRPDFGARLHIREFQAEYDEGVDKPPLVNVRMQLRLLSLPRRESIAETSAQYFVRAPGTSIPDIVTAFDDAFGKAVKRLVAWMVTVIAEQLAEQK